MKVLINGVGGFMGKEVAQLALNHYEGAELVGGIDPNGCSLTQVTCFDSFETAPGAADCMIDFSHHSCTQDLLSFAKKHRIPLVIATTGQTEEEKKAIQEAAKQIPIFFAANFSMGIAVLIELAKKTAKLFPDAEIEIVEKHHDRKLDAPSGTALAIAKGIQEVRPRATIHSGRSGNGKRTKEEIGIHAVRMGNIVGEHEVMIGTQNQTLTLKHEAHSRALFAEGALTAAAFLQGKPAGLYDMKELVRI